MMGEAVWQFVAGNKSVSQEAIARKVVAKSQHRDGLAASIAL